MIEEKSGGHANAIKNLVRFLNQVQYTNAKVLLVGDSGVGKTGLSNYLALGVKDEERNIFAAERRLSVARRFQRRE